MQKKNTVYIYCITFYFFMAALIYTVFHTFVTWNPVLSSYRSATEVTEALSNQFVYSVSHDHNATGLGTSLVDINIAGNGGDKSFRIYGIFRTCNMSYLKLGQSHALPFHCSHLMTLALSMGRTGNLMFQYAALLGVAHRHNYTAVINPKFPLINIFNLPNIADVNISGMIRLNANKAGTYDRKFEKIDVQHNYTLFGYLQSWCYFNEINNTIRRIYKVKDIYMKPALNFLKRVSRQGRPNVCVHIRRGDFLLPHNNERGFVVAGLGYIDKAMSYFKTRLNDPLFFVLSDDKRWCKSNLNRTNTVISPFDNAYVDLAMMTYCDHVIVTSGSFGWWGAWLSNGTVVYYKDYPRPNTWLGNQFHLQDYYPPSWIGLA